MQALTGMIAACSMCAFTAEKSLTVKELPPAVRKIVREQLKDGETKTISKEPGKGVTQYDVESVLNGKRRDRIPAAASAAILKKVGAIQ